MADLFPARAPVPPLAEAMRPKTLADVIGQAHLLGPGKPLRVAFESGEPHSMILWGPPGVGKTTLARLMANAFDAEFIALSAVLSGVKDIREAVERAEQFRAHGRRTLAFVDEVHRFDKGGDAFYDQISALHKSVRGSDPDGALYWFCRMLDGGADPRYLARRIVRMAWEDIGLADPRAARITLDAAETYERLGSPEGELALAQAILYL